MWVRILLLICVLLSIGACSTSNANMIAGPAPTASAQDVPAATATASLPVYPTREEAATPTPASPPVRATMVVEEDQETLVPIQESPRITILYDNNPYDWRLKTSWGFSALVEFHQHTLLFDTGGDSSTLLENMRILGVDPASIQSVVLSHAHGDHTGGLAGLLDAGARPVVYLLPSFPASFKRQVKQFTQVVEVAAGLSIAEEVQTTGEMRRNTPEQALVIKTEPGLVVITGCAHPGIIEILTQVREISPEPIHLVLGGFHLGNKSKVAVAGILRDFRRLEVEQVAPCHCTGEGAIAMFAAEYGEDFIRAGVGTVIDIGMQTGLN